MRKQNEKVRYSTIDSKSQLVNINGGKIPVIVFVKLWELYEWAEEKIDDWYKSLL